MSPYLALPELRQSVPTSVATQPTVQQNAEVPAEARAIINAALSPFCPGLTLQACTSPSADSLRRVIVARVRSGDAPEKITADLYADYGEAIRAAPLKSGAGLVVWVVPGLVVAIAALMLTYWLRSRRRRTGALASVWRDEVRADASPSVTWDANEPDVARLQRILRQDP